ncbi:uncharacterized protein LOC121382129 isoform X2 [Gigantopelta aegis]|uniref:uncharacterized protein LOC121382129 isoform X2 n=1 Tax=Gigantopelta aegis TaxID=1735272 RepID=UPI001B88CC69|nr:uncharacterized protein LOC121382129 isoform X2 [Gigantopelta aegis]
MNDLSTDGKNAFFSEVTLISSDEAANDVCNHNDVHYDTHRSTAQPVVTPPFVECKVSDVDGKALISTCCKKSLLSKSMFNTLRLPDTRLPNVYTSILLQDRRFDYRFEVRDDIPDIVIGIDFLITYKCVVNFRDMTLSIDCGALDVPFLEKTDIPLKYRVHRNLAASF